MRKGYGLARTGSTEDVSTVTAMMLAIGEGEGCSAAHAHVGVDPFWRSAAFQHVARNFLLGGEVEALVLQGVVDFVDVSQADSALCGSGPALDQLQHLALDIMVGCNSGRCAEQRGHVVEKLSGGDFLNEVGATVLDARVSEIQGG